MRFDQPIAVQEQAFAGPDQRLFLFIVHVRRQAERHPGRPQFEHAAGGPLERQIVTGVGGLPHPGLRIDDYLQAGDERVCQDLVAQQIIHLFALAALPFRSVRSPQGAPLRRQRHHSQVAHQLARRQADHRAVGGVGDLHLS